MLRRLKQFLARLADPSGPVGNVISPSAVYKERLGLPISSPHTLRLAQHAPAHAEHTLAPARFIAAEAALAVPKDRVRQVSAFIEEVWAPVYGTTTSLAIADILRASQTLIGWQVTQRVRAAHCDCTTARFERHADGEYRCGACGRGHAKLSAEDFQQVLQSMQFAPNDEMYNVYLDTVPGNDPVILDGKVLTASDGTVIRGGTQIRHGKREYRQKTAGFAHWDKGFLAKRQQALAEEASRPIRNVQRALEAVKGEKLPMWRPVGVNPRKDRMRG